MTRAGKAGLITVALLVGLGVGVAAYEIKARPQPAFHATDITGVQWAQGFELTDHNGQVRTMSDFRGKVVLVFFGYTHCPDVCPGALAELAQVVKQLGRDAGDVQVLFITTDPARDTPQRLASYVTAFHPSFIGLRGDADQTAEVAGQFKVYFRSDAPTTDHHATHAHASYMVNHSSGIIGLDREGRPRLYIGAQGRTVEAMTHDIQALLQS